ncbi:hypothetical protein [Stygiolobus sp. RP850M]|uniref:hypothetical protein n=1 Tax=Stygiolobus sp. RP850M TaxID=3133137 RepID=UPI00307D2834
MKLLRVYFQLDEILSFAMEELGGDEIAVEISAVKDRVRKVIERMIKLEFFLLNWGVYSNSLTEE